ncbi:hypothetical protein MKW94_008031 [Papaver nudicaule]|uniref:RRM domain-containing protein n=1 Tax=Papaver nudicaule TaxID=74823 RepID=A0AA41VFB4_PAPNU|nr:hypothetical protein [Papaver nudicaule]
MFRSQSSNAPRSSSIVIPPPPAPLNPYAIPFEVENVEQTPRDRRSMFITFSNGFPLTERQIITFFTQNWGPVVEEVEIEQADNKKENPQYGKVVFRDPAVIPLILNGERRVKFVVHGRHLWARIYVPKKNGRA